MTRDPQVRVVSRLLVAQAAVTAATTLPFGRRQASALAAVTLLVAALLALAVYVRRATATARTAVFAIELMIFVVGLYALFVDHVYLGGTMFAMVVAVVLLHPAVARAFTVRTTDTAHRPAPDAAPSPSHDQVEHDRRPW